MARRPLNAYTSVFELIENNVEMIDNQNDSFLISIYRQLLVDLSSRWNIGIPILDFNLARLRQCAKKCLLQLQQQQRQEQLQLQITIPTTATFAIEELPLALEFYLQMDGESAFLLVPKFFFSFDSRSLLFENLFISSSTTDSTG